MNIEILKKAQKKRLVFIATIPRFFVHIINNIKELEKNGFDIQLVSSFESYGDYLKHDHGFKIDYIEIPREISPLKDVKALFLLYLYLRKNKFDIVHSLTPKAGIVVALASFAARVPIRIHTFTGQRWATLSGAFRSILKTLDKIVIKLNTRCYADSKSQIDYLISENVAKPSEVFCIHEGALGGVDIEKFHLNKNSLRTRISQELNIPMESPWILFLGRVTRDKGINELVKAFEQSQDSTKAYLIIVGPYEQDLDPVDPSTVNSIKNNPFIKHMGFQNHPEQIIAACDFLCLPSYREGFGTVIIEAAAAGVCTIGSNIPGIQDAIIDEKTGVLVPVKDIHALKEQIIRLSNKKQFREELSHNAFLRAQKDFNYQIISQFQVNEYRQLLANRNT
nr:glycosyltransferase [Bacteriovorax sp. HI3]